MNANRLRTIGLALALTSTPALARHGGEAAVELPDGRELHLNGRALQQVLFLKLYRVELFLEQPTRSAAHALKSDQVKRLRLECLRDLPRGQVTKALREGIARVAPGRADELADRVELLTSRLPEVRKNDELVMTYYPGKGTVLESDDGGRTVIPGKDFADALFGIWLSPNTDAPKVRRGLLGL